MGEYRATTTETLVVYGSAQSLVTTLIGTQAAKVLATTAASSFSLTTVTLIVRSFSKL